MFLFEVLIPALGIGTALYLLSDTLAHFFERTGSVNLIRGLDNPWTFKTFAFVIAIGWPLYHLALGLIASSL